MVLADLAVSSFSIRAFLTCAFCCYLVDGCLGCFNILFFAVSLAALNLRAKGRI